MRVQQQDIPEWGNLSSKLQTPVHLHGRRCWMRLPLPTWAHAAQTGLREAEAGQGTRTVLWATHLPWGRRDRELCGEETQEKVQQKRQQSVWKRPYQQERVDSCVERRIQVFTRWAVLHFSFLATCAWNVSSPPFSFKLLWSLFLFHMQLSGVTQWAACWSEESSVCPEPQLGPPAPSPVAPECPPGWPTATPSANGWKRLRSVKSAPAAKWCLTDWRYIPHFYCPNL